MRLFFTSLFYRVTLGVLLMACTIMAWSASVRIHYNRDDGNYNAWGVHVWGGSAEQTDWKRPIKPSGTSDFGVYYDVELAPGADGFGFILHRGNTKNVPTDMRYSLAEHGKEVWQRQGDTTLYTRNPLSSPPVAEPIKPEPQVKPVEAAPKPDNTALEAATKKALAAQQAQIKAEQLRLQQEQSKLDEARLQAEKARLEVEKTVLEKQASAAQPLHASSASEVIVASIPVVDVSASMVEKKTEPPVAVASAAKVGLPVESVSHRQWLWWVLAALLALLGVGLYLWRKTSRAAAELGMQPMGLSVLDRETLLEPSQTVFSVVDQLAMAAENIEGVSVITRLFPDADLMFLKSASDQLLLQLDPCVVVLGAAINGELLLVGGVSSELQNRFRAIDLMSHIASKVGGKAGGRNRSAHSVGGDVGVASATLKKVGDWVRTKVGQESANDASRL